MKADVTGARFPLIFEIVRPCTKGELCEHGTPISNRKGNKFWARPHYRSSYPDSLPRDTTELVVCVEPKVLPMLEKAVDYLKQEWGIE